MTRGILLLVFLVLAGPAGALTLDGAPAQGALVTGRVAPGSAVSLDGTPVRVAADGLFVIGFGRDAPARATLSVTGPDGAAETRALDVAPGAWEVQRIDGLPPGKVTPEPEDLERIRADNAAIGRVRARDTATPWFAAGFRWPAQGRISGVFGAQRILNGEPRSPHNGVDIAAPEGTVVAAGADGVVALVHPDMFYSGRTVMIDHGHGLSSVYIHMSEILVAEGQRVRAGEAIGKVGMSGRATGPHLHWGVSWFRTHVDPARLAGPMTGGR